MIETSEDCAVPPAHVPDPPSTPTVCTGPPSPVGAIPPSSPAPPDELPLPDGLPELDPLELEPLLEGEDPLELAELPELDPLNVGAPELDAPELELPEAGVSLGSEPPVVELLAHPLPATAMHARHPVSAKQGRTLVVLFMSMMVGP